MPLGVFTPVLPPTAASTIASSVVGTCTTRTPRSQVAATNPPRSVVAPPPTVTIASERVKPASPSSSQQTAATDTVLARSPSGTGSASTSKEPARRSSTGRARSGSALGEDHADALHRLPEQLRQASGQAAAHHDVVRRRAADVQHGDALVDVRRAVRRDRVGAHASAFSISRATSSGVRPSVSTTSEATPS